MRGPGALLFVALVLAATGLGFWVGHGTVEVPAQPPPMPAETEENASAPLMEWDVTGRFSGVDAGPAIVLMNRWCTGDRLGCSFTVLNGSTLEAHISFKNVGGAAELPVEFFLVNGAGERVYGQEADSNPGLIVLTVEGGVEGSWELRSQALGDAGYRDVAFQASFVVR